MVALRDVGFERFFRGQTHIIAVIARSKWSSGCLLLSENKKKIYLAGWTTSKVIYIYKHWICISMYIFYYMLKSAHIIFFLYYFRDRGPPSPLWCPLTVDMTVIIIKGPLKMTSKSRSTLLHPINICSESVNHI